jgi:hypothetical protein
MSSVKTDGKGYSLLFAVILIKCNILCRLPLGNGHVLFEKKIVFYLKYSFASFVKLIIS